jgi:DNA-binding winged helix-turn-helix (wHTH) protein
MAQEDGPVYRFAGRVLDLRRGILAAADGLIDLRPKSLAVLVHLVRNAGRVIGRDELLTTVWPDVIVGDDSLTQCIRDLRRAIDDEVRTLVRTIARRGYLFDAAALEPAAAARALAVRYIVVGRLGRPPGRMRVSARLLDAEVAADWGRAALRLNARYTPAHRALAAALGHLGRRDEAGAVVGQLRGLVPGLTVSGFARASLYRFSGRLDILTDGCGRPDFPTSAPQVAFGPRRMRMRERTLRHCSAAAASPCSSQVFAFWAASYSARSPWAEYSRRA